MEIVHEDATELIRYLTARAMEVSGGNHPVLVDKYLERQGDARSTPISDGEQVS